MVPQPIPAGETGIARPQPARERWRHLFCLLRDYWTSSDWKFAWFAVIFLLSVQFVVTYGFVLSNRWQQDFFNSLERREAARFVPLMLMLVGIWALQIVTSLAQVFVGMNLAIRWRAYMTDRYLGRWMAHDRFIEIERLRMIDNPDQRVADDVARVTAANDGVLGIVVGGVGAIIGCVTFGRILLQTADDIRLSIAGLSLSIPGSTIWYAAAYAFLGSMVIAAIGRPYIRTLMGLQHREGDFRAGLLHVRRNAPQIGFSNATGIERRSLDTMFANIRLTYRSLILRSLGLNLGQGLYDRIGGILPYFLLVPRYFAGAMSLGQVMSGRDAFSQMVGYLSYFIQAFGVIGARIADLNRLKALDDAIDHARPRGIKVAEGSMPAGVVIATSGLSLYRPHGAPLLTIGDWQVRASERWLVQGPSGSGKSTLLRAIAGLWPDGRGEVALASGGLAMFVPQRLYLPMGTLKAAICFPDAAGAHDDAAIAALLARVRLSAHVEHIHALRLWQDELSPGEQQRVALARILLHRPDLLMLDEATSALDADNARFFHEQILTALPDLTLVSVVHDEHLERYHTHALTIADDTVVQRTLREEDA